MKLEVSYEDVKDRYAEVIDEAMGKLRKGRSKDKNVPPEDMDWSFDWGVMIQGEGSFEAMLRKAAKQQAQFSPDEIVHKKFGGQGHMMRGQISLYGLHSPYLIKGLFQVIELGPE